MLAATIMQVTAGDITLEKANTLHKLAKDVSDSLYTEAKTRLFLNEADEGLRSMGTLRLGSK